MKLIDILNRRCNCRIIKIVIVAGDTQKCIYKNTPDSKLQEYTVDINLNDTSVSILYSAQTSLTDDDISLIKDLIEVYIERNTIWNIIEQVSTNQEIIGDKGKLEEIIKIATNELVTSGLFSKIAFMFFNEKLKYLRGYYIASNGKYSQDELQLFKDIKIPVETELLDRLYNYNNTTNLIENSIEIEDKIFHLIDNKKLPNSILVTPIARDTKIYGVLLTYSDNPYGDLHVYSTYSVARILCIMIMAEISDYKCELSNAFYKEVDKDIQNKQHLLTLGNCVATITHEIRNTITSIGGFARQLVKSIPDANLKHMAQIISNESIRLERLTEDMLSFAKKNKPNKEVINLHTLLNSVVIPLFEERVKKHNFKIEMDIKKDIQIYADINQMKQVFVNIISNAMNAMECDGTISIHAQENNGKFFIDISDTGPGIASDIIPNLFKPFFTTRSSGTGLGLSISKKIMNDHDGDLTAKNSNKGAIFTISLPTE